MLRDYIDAKLGSYNDIRKNALNRNWEEIMKRKVKEKYKTINNLGRTC